MISNLEIQKILLWLNQILKVLCILVTKEKAKLRYVSCSMC